MMKPERRRSPRSKPDNLVYISMEPENGGIVLDVSEGGLAFHVVAPVERAGPIHLWFSFEAGTRLEATGELAWTDETKKVGGLRFTHLAEGVHEQIRSWIARSTIPMTSGGGFAASVAPPKEFPGSRGGEQGEDVVPTLSGPRQQDTASFQTRTPSIVPSQFAFTPESEPMWDPVPATWPGPASRPRFIPGVITGILILALLAAAFLLHSYRHEVGDSLVRLGERIAPRTEPQTASPAPAAAIPAPNPSPADAASADKRKTGDASGPSALNSTAPATAVPAPNPSPTDAASADKRKARDASGPSALNPPAPGSAEDSPRNPESVSTGESELTIAQQYLRGSNRQRNTAAAAQWLWAAVKKGNTTAELLLADLYRSGDGVRKSCEQARALLIAASRRGNVIGMEKLRELNRIGCR